MQNNSVFLTYEALLIPQT